MDQLGQVGAFEFVVGNRADRGPRFEVVVGSVELGEEGERLVTAQRVERTSALRVACVVNGTPARRARRIDFDLRLCLIRLVCRRQNGPFAYRLYAPGSTTTTRPSTMPRLSTP